jgi:hypothetical protein
LRLRWEIHLIDEWQLAPDQVHAGEGLFVGVETGTRDPKRRR